MKTKSRAVRRNSYGYELQDDVCISDDVTVNDSCLPIPVLEDLGPAVSLLLQENGVSDDVVIRGDGFGHSVDMAVSMGCNRGPSGVVDLPVRTFGGITINEPDSCRAFAGARSQQFPGSVDYVGKGKRKVGDVSPVTYDGDADVPTFASVSSLGPEIAEHVFSTLTDQFGIAAARAPCVISQPNNASTSAAEPIHNVGPAVLPLAGQNSCADHQSRSSGRGRPPTSYARMRTPLRAAARRAPPDSSIPVRNVGGAPATYVSLGHCNRVCRHCNALFWFGERLKQGGVRFPEYHRCCMGGKVVLRAQPDYPIYLKQLFTFPHFMDNIRAYNSMFAMTSLGAEIDESVNRGRGPYVFKVSGQIYHWIGGLCPADDTDPRFLQLYIFDTQNEVENRLQHFDAGGRTLNPQIVEALIHLLDDHNELVRIFRTARDLLAAGDVPEFKIRLFAVAGSKQHELPAGDSIGAIVYEGGPDTGTEFDVVIHRRAGEAERVSKLHPSYMSLQFPLLFIYGEDGFHIGLRLWDVRSQSIDEDKKLSMKMYYSYQLHDRFQQYTLLTRGGRLFQQYVVTAYCSVESYRLDFIRKHQDDIRNDYLAGLYDAIARGDRSGSQAGMRTILPASFVGGPRYMYSHYLDALAICRVHGNPSFFITFTCNVKWPEILDFMEQFAAVTVADRPDIVDRVFEQKIHQLIAYLRDSRPFGPVAAVLYTVEFQKRGLPHCHLLLWIEERSRVQTNADIDRYVAAEIPDRDSDPEGYRIVTELMMHGPCGLANMFAVCMKGGDKCTKGFPKPYCNATSIDNKGYVHYRRRATSAVTVRQNVQLDNGYVVPYNMSLLRRFYAHINVEYCEWTMLIKYLFKYISKGTDRIVTQIARTVGDTASTSRAPTVTVDEIKNYLDARYIGPHEACWRIFGFDIHYRDPPVQILAVHLENMQRVLFRTSESLESVVDNPSNKKTTLTQWLDFNTFSTLGRHLTYLQFPSEFVWNGPQKYWSPRCNLNKPSIGRLSYVHPSAGDLFYQRLLLCHQKGCTSFPGIRTVDDYVYATNRAACEAMGLLAGDGEWSLALVEAALLASAAELRQLFCQILIFCDVASPLSLWNNHWRLMSDDIPRMLSALLHMPEVSLNDEELQGGILYELEGILSFYGRSVTDFDLRLPPTHLMSILSNRTVMEERSYDPEAMAHERDFLVPNLNTEQRALFDTVIDAVANNRQELIFVYGHGGTGKTFVWKSIIYTLRAQRKIVLAVASSGIASLLLPGGRTAHSRFKLPLDLTNESMCSVKKHTQLADLLMQTDIVIWDEAPMSERRCFETLDRTLRDILDAPSHVFGGKSVILGGDFRQTLPVKKKATKQEIISSCITQSYLWRYFKVHLLTENMRLNRPSAAPQENHNIRMFSQWLLDVGNGTIGQPDNTDPDNASWIHIPDIYRIPNTENAKQELIRFIYDDSILQAPTPELLQERAIICPKNDTADSINADVLRMLSGVGHTYASNDEAIPRGNDGGATELLYPIEYLNTLSFSGIPPHNLQLKIGAPVMLLRNLNLAGGLCNGTRMIVTQMLAKVIEARIVTGTRMSQKVFLPRIMLFNREDQLPFIFKRKQFPVKVCYAMTINKSQGQSLNRIGIYLPEPIFGHGQLYVALSRATSPHGLRILASDQPDKPASTTKNIVYRDFLETIVRDEVIFVTSADTVVCFVAIPVHLNSLSPPMLANLFFTSVTCNC